jgi:hypothetical protein
LAQPVQRLLAMQRASGFSTGEEISDDDRSDDGDNITLTKAL